MLLNLPHQVKSWYRSSTRGIQDLLFLERTLSVNTMHRHIKKAWGWGMLRELVLSPAPCLWKATKLNVPFLHITVHPMPSSKSNPVLGSIQDQEKKCVSPLQLTSYHKYTDFQSGLSHSHKCQHWQ